jgi:hypothetical protein
MSTLDFTDDELRDAAMAARVAARQAEQDAAMQTNPRINRTFREATARYTQLSDKFEHARARCKARAGKSL